MLDLGLKLWSTNKQYIEPALKLYEEGYFDYIELYCVPDTYAEYIDLWKKMKIPFIVHATHSVHGFNLADKASIDNNLKLFEGSRAFADALEARYIIVHPGVIVQPEGIDSHQTVIQQLKHLNDGRILIENKPFLSVNHEDICAGNSPGQIKEYMNATGLGFCLDINHAFNHAKHKKKDFLKIIEEFTSLNPATIHVCGIGARFDVDKHLHFKEGDVNILDVFQVLKKTQVRYCTLETPKGESDSLDDFREDVTFLRKIMRRVS